MQENEQLVTNTTLMYLLKVKEPRNPLRSHKGLLDKDASYPCCHQYEV